MNSWYVETLLRNRERVRSSIIEDDIVRANDDYNNQFSLDGSHDDENPGYSAIPRLAVSTEVNLDDDDYNNLLAVEAQLISLFKNNQLSKKEIAVVKSVLTHQPLHILEKQIGMSRYTISSIFSKVCDRVAFLLGQEFTDDGYLELLGEKYHLTEEQIGRARAYMNSNKRHFKAIITRRI